MAQRLCRSPILLCPHRLGLQTTEITQFLLLLTIPYIQISIGNCHTKLSNPSVCTDLHPSIRSKICPPDCISLVPVVLVPVFFVRAPLPPPLCPLVSLNLFSRSWSFKESCMFTSTLPTAPLFCDIRSCTSLTPGASLLVNHQFTIIIFHRMSLTSVETD